MNHHTERERRTLWVFLAALVPYLVLAASFWFVTDDAYISFRYARNLAAGEGLRFNPGETPPVEGYSNFLWTAAMAGVEAVHLDPAQIAPILSLALGAILLWLIHLTLTKDLALPPMAVFPGLLCAALAPSFAVWSTGGLETMLFALLLFSSWRHLMAEKPVPAGVASGLMALTRPEGLLWVLGLAVLFLVKERKAWKKPALYLAVALAIFLPYLVFRWCYFGQLLPNTLHAKSALNLTTLHRGFNYTAGYLVGTITPLVILLFTPLVRGTAGVVCFAFVIYSIASGGDFMAMGRFMAPSVPFFAVAAALLLDRFLHRHRQLLTCAALLVLIQLLPALGVDTVPSFLHYRWNSPKPRSELEQWRLMKRNVEEWTYLGKALKGCTRPGDTYVAAAIGAVGYFSNRVIYDQCGLVDLEVSRQPADPTKRLSAGHDKMVEPEFFLPRSPTVLRAKIVQARAGQKTVRAMKKSLPPGYEIKSLPLASKTRFLVMQRRIP